MIGVLLAVVLVVAGLLLTQRRSGSGERGRQDALIDTAGPAVCRMVQLVADGSLAEASNVFWDEVHTGAHVLAARLDTADRPAEARFLEAKGALEAAFPTLAPSLTRSVPEFAAAFRSALRIAGRPEVAACT